jgi:hypothetical protein
VNYVRFLLLSASAAITATGSIIAALPIDYSAQGSYLWTENIGRASGPSDFRDASTYEAAFTAGMSRQLSSGLLGRVQLETVASTTPDYDLLDEATFGPRGILRKKFGLGPDAPVLSFELASLGRLARTDENNGVTLEGVVTLSKRFGPYVSVLARGEWQEHVASANTYDVHHYGASAAVTIDPTDRLRFSAGVGRLSGTFTVGASAARFAGALGGALGPDVAAYYATIPTTVTNTFSPGWIAYRVEGDVDYWWFDASPALTDNLTLSVRYERTHTVNIVNVDYYQDIFSVSLLYAF